jgi:hypothetical protein
MTGASVKNLFSAQTMTLLADFSFLKKINAIQLRYLSGHADSGSAATMIEA